MIRYRMTEIAGERRTGVVRLPPIRDRVKARLEYQAALRAMLREIAAGVRNDVMPLFVDYRRTQRAQRAADAALATDGRSWFARLRATLVRLQANAAAMAENVFRLEGNRHTDTFRRDVKRALGIDIRAVISDEDLDEVVRTAVARNVALIESLSTDTLRRIEARVLEAKLSGASAKSLRKQLVDEFGIASRRADLIAADQMAKLTSDINRVRHEQAGITHYEWSTSRDERVRPRHRKLDGTVYQYGEETGAEQGLPPGKPVRCRCVAIARVEFGPKAGQQPAVKQAPAAIAATETNDTAKAYVLAEGRRSGHEYLSMFDAATGELIQRHTDGRTNSVGYGPKGLEALKAGRPVITHHNHPSNSSFSRADLLLLTHPGSIMELFAHGHKGATFRGVFRPERKGKRALTKRKYDAAAKKFAGEVRALIAAGRISISDANVAYYHAFNRRLAARGFFDYEFQFNDAATEQAVERLERALK